ncbi:Cytochrome oxidase biogenesis protein Sco1/SenC/PrrC, putative copper metallochaperone [Metapseudomonas furukawaii]|uniref:Cytochrome oxidase biogenesis protein Sco1/SenC/PrrC n=1 Tax=Metapseudomonas furukawaii TaxID=1149133 RepID=A0AAD1C4A1_METFU|nr:Cytochrome oxidase biogenesis protein Sco1/SenC/PrrC, putative copper metallochaperone [Pseudomonas furukawaii]BAU76682.1 cytochrome oxidase biogenesis protein Sco1/SenC/PrrC [Pseudomonas furukawaii]
MDSLTSVFRVALLSLGLLAGAAAAHSPEEHAALVAANPGAHAPETRVTLADVPLVDQEGRPVNLSRELAGDRISVVGFVYTQCTTVCPVISAILQKLQKQLGERAGREVQLVSLSIDPQRDTPERLKEYADRFSGGEGWRWVTGSQEAITETLKGFGTFTPNFEEHPPLIMVGDGRTGQWTRFYGFTDPAVLLARVDELRAAREALAAQPTARALAGGGTRDAQSYFTDTLLKDQNGRELRFYSDVLKGRRVMLNVIFTHCDDACPLITRKLKAVREAMDEDLAREVYFISLTSDAERDTPEVLKAFATRHGVDSPNWIFLTGARADMDLVLARLGQLGETPEGHSTLLIAGDVPNKRWSKIRPDAPVEAIAQRLQLMGLPPVAGR